ncbi:type II secretion system protein N [Woodsholea maritima]|uniref:type II secretion system protein N n=1 Tax=Woodsholea maritima TaxID=240237 RepID=UPI000378BEAF|nr:type II secretion system protein N [Woodsholea maritima]
MSTYSRFQSEIILSVIRPGVEVVALGVLVFILVQMGWFFFYGSSAKPLDLAPIRQSSASQSQAGVHGEIGVLRDGALFGGEAVSTPVNLDMDAPETQLNLVLYGVRRGDDPQSGTAVIGGAEANQRAFAVGSDILDGVRLEAVYPDRVIINRRGARESLYLREEERGRSAATTLLRPVEARAPSAQGAMGREAWINGLRLEPVRENGAMQGFRVQASSRQDLLSAAQLQVGDVVTAVNGRVLTTPADLIAAMDAFAGSSSVRLNVLRGGEARTIEARLQ